MLEQIKEMLDKKIDDGINIINEKNVEIELNEDNNYDYE